MSARASYPARAPPPFPEPVLLPARRCHGTVAAAAADAAPSEPPPDATTDGAAVASPRLERQVSAAGNILVIDDPEGGGAPRTFWLQRKLRETRGGSLRVGYALARDRDGAYRVAPAPGGSDNDTGGPRYAIAVQRKAAVLSESAAAPDALAALSAPQLVAAPLEPDGESPPRRHVHCPELLAADAVWVYTVAPHGSTLADHCAAAGGPLPEGDARFFFRQILKGLETLQRVGICHRGLSLETLRLRGTTLEIADFSSALRIPVGDSDGAPAMIEPQPLAASGGLGAPFLAPELFGGEAFDGGAVDLWSAAVVLFVLLLGAEPLFALPSPGDPRFREICLQGRLERVVRTQGRKLSPEATDLLQRMLTASPTQRPTLAQVRRHAWVTMDADPPQLPSPGGVLG